MTEKNPDPFMEVFAEVINREMPEEDRANVMATVSKLIDETVKLRHELKAESGHVLTVGDCRAALAALDDRLKGRVPKQALTVQQQLLLERWIKRLTRKDAS